MSAPAPNPRASLLAGLRTGGVRSASASFPQTAGPTASSFNVSTPPRFVSQRHPVVFPEDVEYAESLEMQQNAPTNHHGNGLPARNMPMTAAVDGLNNCFAHQQSLHANLPFSQAPMNAPMTPNALSQPSHLQQQALQMQMMQLEIMRIQAVQAQQYQAQAELLAQAQQRSQLAQTQARDRRISLGFNPPASAGPLSTGFDLRSATLSAQVRRANQAEQLRSQLGQAVTTAHDDQVPMTASLGGRFGSRTASVGCNSLPSRLNSAAFERDDTAPPTPNSTTVISGGTPLGKASVPASSDNVPSKSDAAVSWRRGGSNSVLTGPNRSITSPSVRITPPPGEILRISPPPASSIVASGGTTPVKTRPQPLQFSTARTEPIAVAIGSASSDPADNEQDVDDTSSSGSSAKSAVSNSSPTTPHSSSSNESPLSPREEATKKLYEGLGIGRPGPSPIPLPQVVVNHRMASQPLRQPRGPPSGLDELGPKNFATRIRRQAIGGLGMLMGARERREVVEVF